MANNKKLWSILLTSIAIFYILIPKDLTSWYIDYFHAQSTNNALRLNYQSYFILLLLFALIALASYIQLLRYYLRNPTCTIQKLQQDSRFYVTDFFLLGIIIFAYHVFFWNKYLPIQEGWFSIYSMLIQKGKIPYRDFYMFLTPIYPYWIAAINSIFGDAYIVLRTYGIFERLALSIVLYLVFRKISARSIALIASVSCVIASGSLNVEVSYSYNQIAYIFIFLSCYFVLRYLENQRSGLLLIAGIFGGCAFETKQSIGLIEPFALFVGLLLFAVKTRRIEFLKSVIYVLGFLIPFIVTCIILYRLNALHEYIAQIFPSAVSSKGGFTSVLYTAILRSSLALLFWLPILLIVTLPAVGRKNLFSSNAGLNIFFVVTGVLVTIFLGVLISQWIGINNDILYFNIKEGLVPIIIDSNIILFVTLSFSYLREKVFQPEQFKLLLLSLLSVGLLFGGGLSGIYLFGGCAFSLALLVILLFKMNIPNLNNKNRVIYSLCLLLIGATLVQHLVWPYKWWGWAEQPVKLATVTPTQPLLKGLKLTKTTNDLYDQITGIITKYSNPNDPIYVFPHMPIFYFLTGKIPFTFSVTDYFDVCSDACAEQTAKDLLVAQPKVIIVENFPPKVWKYHELVYRQNHPSGQRKIIAAINYLTTRKNYVKMASFLAYPPPDYKNYDNDTIFTIDVWVKT